MRRTLLKPLLLLLAVCSGHAWAQGDIVIENQCNTIGGMAVSVIPVYVTGGCIIDNAPYTAWLEPGGTWSVLAANHCRYRVVGGDRSCSSVRAGETVVFTDPKEKCFCTVKR